MRFDAKLTLDGIMTLIAGVIAFIAVIIQIRSSSRQVQDHIKAQRDAGEAGRQRERQAVAAALLSEMDCFYAGQLAKRNELFESWKRMENDPQSIEVFHSVVGKPFAAYESLADKLGGFDATVARGIVLAYSFMAAFAEVLKLYEEEMSHTSSEGGAGQEIRRQTRDAMRNTIRQSAELAVKAVATVCRVLCRLSDTDFSTLFVAKDSQVGSQDTAIKLP